MPTIPDSNFTLYTYKTPDLKADALIRAASTVDVVPTVAQIEHFYDFLLTFWTPTAAQTLAYAKVLGTKAGTSYTGGFLHGAGVLPWTHFRREMIALQLIVRISHFYFINQKKHSVCGPVAWLQGVARDNPEGYAEFIIGLAENRKGKIGSLKVKVRKGSGILGKHAHAKAMPEADYIGLVSLRDSENVFAYRSLFTNRMLEGMSLSGDIVHWMKASGYTKVEDHSHGAWRMAGGLADSHREGFAKSVMQSNLLNMQNALTKGRLVVMRAAGNLAHMAEKDPSRDKKFLTVFGGHFMLVRDIDIGANGVKFDILTWGRETTNLIEIPWSKIGSWYNGYICGKP
jgi:hypothetical protein